MTDQITPSTAKVWDSPSPKAQLVDTPFDGESAITNTSTNSQSMENVVVTAHDGRHVTFEAEAGGADVTTSALARPSSFEMLLGQSTNPDSRPCSSASTSSDSEYAVGVSWTTLYKSEEEQPREEGSDEATALLLARLEQANQAIATDPRSAVRSNYARRQSVAPSMLQLQKLVNQPDTPSIRFSLPSSPPPMTELEFWAALVKDYPKTVQRLPILMSNKLRGGVPPPLRGAVWMSMAGARDIALEQEFDTLCEQSSPYENIINKDIGRSFPGVEMFQDAEGEGQKMLARVLKCFSLYDDKIGYCQGLGFLVGPLLMHMGDKESFCVLVRLMDDYDLRSCFLPDLSGLHLRIFQFQQLLRQHLPELSDHLESLQVEAVYLSQWFLSFFATTCPLNTLFRIYDMIFAEGASETVMRVAMSLMKRNEGKLLGFTEFEDVMQLLLSRNLWDTYHGNADELVDESVSLSALVIRASLDRLEASFREAQNEECAMRAGFFPEVQAAASRFLGRMWTPSPSNHSKSASLSPGFVPLRPTSLLRRSTSKQSFSSTSDSVDRVFASPNSTNSTREADISTIPQGLHNDNESLGPKSESISPAAQLSTSTRDRDLHGQIEDLLMMLGDLQREHAILTEELQREREERNEDHEVVRHLVEKLKNDSAIPRSFDRRKSAPFQYAATSKHKRARSSGYSNDPDLNTLLATVSARLPRFTSLFTSRSLMQEVAKEPSLSEDPARSRAALQAEIALASTLATKPDVAEKNTAELKDQLAEARGKLAEETQERQRLEQVIKGLKPERNSVEPSSNGKQANCGSMDPWQRSAQEAVTNRMSVSGDLGGFRLDRTGSESGGSSSSADRSSKSSTTQLTEWTTSSLNESQPQPKESASQAVDVPAIAINRERHPSLAPETILNELVKSKTAEAIARQELEEVKARYESLRKRQHQQQQQQMLSPSPPSTPANSYQHSHHHHHKKMSSTITIEALGSGITSSDGLSLSSSGLSPSPAAESRGGWFWGRRSASAGPVA